jgi:hypothetical protein
MERSQSLSQAITNQEVLNTFEDAPYMQNGAVSKAHSHLYLSMHLLPLVLNV